jgi:hypothetical protein
MEMVLRVENQWFPTVKRKWHNNIASNEFTVLLFLIISS